MFTEYAVVQFGNYHQSRDYYLSHPEKLESVERYFIDILSSTIEDSLDEIIEDYNEASYLYPFWQNYPPENRGRSPIGDQVPWIEVGEHAIGNKVERLIAQKYIIRETGLPSGADDRFLLTSGEIESKLTITDSIMAFVDIKSVGPRDSDMDLVVSPYQVSGDGLWANPSSGMQNSIVYAVGARASHEFAPAIPPIYCLSNGIIAPTVHAFIKPIYEMIPNSPNQGGGQPLKAIKIACIPNGLLLCVNPDYLSSFPGLMYPGKDDRTKPLPKRRARFSMGILERISPWRVTVIDCSA